eukprot:TRINITY_DN1797_c0_g4_i1.p1 TRINITY_DN1797_c0_g4~~TRINITY_DN1797_c0_g4_i1.p1  ORF type:complete len:889 (+),score=457.69 TRINITY_DN1797_c0_g4_i1:58-2724(+)
MGGDKGGKGYKGDGGKGGKGGGGKGGGGKGKGPPSTIPLRDATPLGKAPSSYLLPMQFTEKAPMYSRERLSKTDQTTAKETLSKALGAIPRPVKPGTLGKPAELLTNDVELKMKDNMVIYQYDVKFMPEIRSRKLHMLAVESILTPKQSKDFACVVAGDTVYANEKLKELEILHKPAPTDKYVRFAGEDGVIKLKADLTKEVSTAQVDQEVITVFSKVLKSVLDTGDMQRVNRTYFDTKQAVPLGMKHEVVPGIHLTLKQSSFGSGLALTIDVVHKVMWKKTIYDELDLSNRKNHRRLDNVKDTICLTTYDAKDKKKRTVRIDDVDYAKDENTKIPEMDGKSVKQYVKETYGLDVKAGQPLLVHYELRKNKESGETEKVKEYYLPSLLKLTGLVPQLGGSVLRQQMTEMCAVKPNVRFQKIFSMTKGLLANPKFRGMMEKWGCKAQPGFIVTKGRVLPEPEIQMAQNWTKSGSSWRFDIDRRPQNPTPTTSCYRVIPNALKRVLVVVPEREWGFWEHDLQRVLSRSLQHFNDAHAVDMKVEKVKSFSASEAARVMTSFQGKPDSYLFLVDGSRQDQDAYDTIKKLGVKYGVSTQVAKPPSFIGSKLKSVTNNIAVQMHVKRGNQPWIKKGCQFADTMVIGVGMHHAGEGAGCGEKASVMGFAASMNSTLSDYNMSRVLLKPGMTVARELEQPFKDALEEYKRKNAAKTPKEIVFFRAGGSEGEIPMIMSEEIAKIRECMAQMNVKAKITFFLVLRNSHARIVTMKREENNGIVSHDSAPHYGTVLERHITNPKGYEFFLLSQVANIGSPQAIKYKCLCYDAKEKIDEDKYPKLANDLACMYFNWQGPIALPAPIMYAQTDAKLTGQCMMEDGQLQQPPAKHKLGISNL